MLDALLQCGMYLTVCRADLTRDGAHTPDIDTAKPEKHGQYQRHADGEHRVEREKEHEGRHQTHADSNSLRQRVGDDAYHGVTVADEAVQHVATVAHLATTPLTAQQMFEDATLHTVLGLHAQQRRHPAAGIAQRQLSHHDDDEHHGGAGKRAGGRMRGNVDGLLGGPDEGEVQGHTRHAAQHVDE